MALEIWKHLGRPVQGSSTISVAAADGKRDGNASSFVLIVVLSNNAYGGGWPDFGFRGYGAAARIEKGGGTHILEEITRGGIR